MSGRSEGGPGPQSAKATRECEDTYPNENLELTPEDGLFPRCTPGRCAASSDLRRQRQSGGRLGDARAAEWDFAPA